MDSQKCCHILTFTAVVTLCIGLTNSCFVRNCPPGGKRSMDIVSRGVRPCLSCGPNNQGQCVGPNICCGIFGCYIGTVESQICEKENDSTQPCRISGEPCGSRGQGNCVADRLCCDSLACSYNSKCRTIESSEKLISVLNQILRDQNLEA